MYEPSQHVNVKFLASILFTFCFVGVVGQHSFAAPQQARRKGHQFSPAAQEPVLTAPAIKSITSSVVVDVIVTRKGRHVSGLTRDDFEVYDNGVRQKIVTFIPPLGTSKESRAASRPRAPESARNSPSTAEPLTPAQRRAFALARIHFVTLVLDLGDMQGSDILRATKAAEQYVTKILAPDDFVSIYWVGRSLHLALSFTQDKPAAAGALGQLAAHVSSGAFTANELQETQREIQNLEGNVYGFGSATGPGGGSPSPCQNPRNGDAAQCAMEESELASLRRYMWSQSDVQARAVFTVLRAIALSYRGLPGRKNVVVFSNGFIHSPDAMPELSAAIDAANHADVSFYIVDASRLQAGYSAESASIPTSINAEAFRIAMERPGDIGITGNDKFDWAERIGQGITHQDLGQLASATGGFYVQNENDLLSGLKLVDSDLREFYTLVYRPTDIKFDGSFHTIKVALLRRGYHVRYKRGYWAIPATEEALMTPAAAQLIASVRAGAVQPAFAPRVNAAVLIAPDGKLAAPVVVSVPAKFVKFEREPKGYHCAVNLVLVARTEAGRLVSVYQHIVSLDLKKKEWKEFEKKKRLDIGARLPLDRLESIDVEAILQLPDGPVGMGSSKVTLPENNGTGPLLTSIVLANHIFREHGVSDPTNPLQGQNFRLELPAAPQFSSSDTLTVYFGLLHLHPDPQSDRAAFRLYFSILTHGAPARSFPPVEGKGQINQTKLLVLRQFPLRGLAPGDYELRVKVEGNAHGVAQATAPFIIQPGPDRN